MSALPAVIDVFAGVGGLSLGAARAGFRVAAAVEIDSHAAAAHKLNFPLTAHIEQDVASLTGEELLAAAGLTVGELAGLIGGPPCQGFSSMGHRRHDDSRNSLFVSFFRLVATLRPAFYLAENVPGILDERNDDIRAAALALVPPGYKQLEPFSVAANEFGAPTTRTRVFFLGYDPTRLQAMTAADFLPAVGQERVRVADALRGLPDLGGDWTQDQEGWLHASAPGTSAYGARISGHIPPGVGDPNALERYREHKFVSGFVATKHRTETVKRFTSLKPGKVDRVSKGVRLDPNGFCPTLRAGTGPERGSYQAVRPIHPVAPRVICTREAARLQGFPDWFQFDKTKWHSFRQIGNSVSPIVAEEVLRRIANKLIVNSAHRVQGKDSTAEAAFVESL